MDRSASAPAPIPSAESSAEPDRMLFDGFALEPLRALIPLCNWVHSIDLGNGQTSPGLWGLNAEILAAAAGIDFSGKQVLDIGCWDGFYSFHAEEKGAAAVYATDLISARSYSEFPTFHLAHRLRGSRARYYSNLSVYDLPLLGKSDFDVVLFAGVYYHLRDPLRAFDSIRTVMKRGGLVLVEGAVTRSEGCWANFYHDTAFCNDPTNWWVPTVECLEQWIKSSGFRVLSSSFAGGSHENQRQIMIAEAS
jgi:tRNA (mo5U34)-methyltransferase